MAENVFNTEKGRWVRIPHFKRKTYNGWLTSADHKSEFHLWIYEVGMGFSLTGSTGQSEKTRSFFPRNFSQPAIIVRGQAFDQAHYRKLGEFIREQQLASLKTGIPMHLTIPHGGKKSLVARNKYKQRGRHEGISADGYVLQMNTGGEFGQFSPNYEFTFTISRSHAGVLSWDRAVTTRRLKSWNEIFQNLSKDENTFVTDPDSAWIDQLPGGTL